MSFSDALLEAVQLLEQTPPQTHVAIRQLKQLAREEHSGDGYDVPIFLVNSLELILVKQNEGKLAPENLRSLLREMAKYCYSSGNDCTFADILAEILQKAVPELGQPANSAN